MWMGGMSTTRVGGKWAMWRGVTGSTIWVLVLLEKMWESCSLLLVAVGALALLLSFSSFCSSSASFSQASSCTCMYHAPITPSNAAIHRPILLAHPHVSASIGRHLALPPVILFFKNSQLMVQHAYTCPNLNSMPPLGDRMKDGERDGDGLRRRRERRLRSEIHHRMQGTDESC
ncbi:hypothetical protein BDQ12DRAFT_372891 [Crucibulum laeve]|uniref:Uncharacterized protein n=1 Tax=Crucibulum laeve TaxID=68775 RepID=A0A5C3LME7_9AGAR|nr:hypothetical protein BDQ12DRAFT_263744 [Crucibulum laeve]TFK34349.1 hypothetical protein BDQ12DRAFT_372891 [Crucibulum laeve]